MFVVKCGTVSLPVREYHYIKIINFVRALLCLSLLLSFLLLLLFFVFLLWLLAVIHYFIHQIFSLFSFCLFVCSKHPMAFISRFNRSGAVTILPTILHLTTSVARELAARTAETKAPTVISACLQSLKLLCTHEMMKEEAVAADWLRLLQSAVATLLHYGKPGQCLWAFQSAGV